MSSKCAIIILTENRADDHTDEVQQAEPEPLTPIKHWGVSVWIKLECKVRRTPEEHSSLHGGVKRRKFN